MERKGYNQVECQQKLPHLGEEVAKPPELYGKPAGWRLLLARP